MRMCSCHVGLLVCPFRSMEPRWLYKRRSRRRRHRHRHDVHVRTATYSIRVEWYCITYQKFMHERLTTIHYIYTYIQVSAQRVFVCVWVCVLAFFISLLVIILYSLNRVAYEVFVHSFWSVIFQQPNAKQRILFFFHSHQIQLDRLSVVRSNEIYYKL